MRYKGEPISLLLEDADRSATGELGRPRPRYTSRHAATPLAWHQDALRMSWALACFYGEERYAQWEEAAKYLLKLSEHARVRLARRCYVWNPGRAVEKVVRRS